VLVFVGNIVVIAVVINILSGYFKREQIRTKRAFSPKSLIGTMRPATETGD
jgi:NADH-quinone oxidoreductase subunit H